MIWIPVKIIIRYLTNTLILAKIHQSKFGMKWSNYCEGAHIFISIILQLSVHWKSGNKWLDLNTSIQLNILNNYNYQPEVFISIMIHNMVYSSDSEHDECIDICFRWLTWVMHEQRCTSLSYALSSPLQASPDLLQLACICLTVCYLHPCNVEVLRDTHETNLKNKFIFHWFI